MIAVNHDGKETAFALETISAMVLQKMKATAEAYLGHEVTKVQQLISEYFDGQKPVSGINVDEAVAYGAAVQGAILAGDDGAAHMVILNATPLSTGIEAVGGVMTTLLGRGSLIPTKKSRKTTFRFKPSRHNSEPNTLLVI